MSKRRSGTFERSVRDLYVTPPGPIATLAPFLKDVRGFCEPCVGDGAIVRVLAELSVPCKLALDLRPMGKARSYALVRDALTLTDDDVKGFTHFITNPPWPAQHSGDGQPTMNLLWHLSGLRPTWLLLPADFMHNGYAGRAMRRCAMVVTVGRIKWMPGTRSVGMENAAWYRFHANNQTTVFHAHDKRRIFS